jgi:NTP pyrophosphatase (non-canonical NTP hydrolase)
MNDFDDYQKRVVEIYPVEKSLEYLSLSLSSEVGSLAKEVAQIVRGDYENKGVFVYELAIGRIMDECADTMRYVALIATVLEKKLSDVIEYGNESRVQQIGEENGDKSRTRTGRT